MPNDDKPLRIPEIFSGSVTKDGVHGDMVKRDAAKSIEPDAFGLRPDELAVPEALPDPNGMAFTDDELKALEATDNEAAKALALATSGPEKLALIKDKP